VFFDTIVVCSVTGSTQAGMIAGFAALTRTEGMITDPVYEGKSMAGLIDLIAAARSSPPPRCSTPTSAASPHSTPTARCSPDASIRRARAASELRRRGLTG
jgi:hypothetical protein